jgi:hypothetical protein
MINHKIFEIVKKHCLDDINKTFNWFKTYNSMLCGIPIDLIRKGQQKKVENYISRVLDHCPKKH